MKSNGYAADTSVSEEKTRAEIETILGRHGATHRAVATDEDAHLAQIAFVIRGRRYRLDVPLPVSVCESGKEPRGWWVWDHDRRQQWLSKQNAQERRARWRAVLLMLKAKLEWVRLGASSVEKEFLADMVLANGATMHVAVAQAIKHGLETGKAPMLALPEST